MSQYGYGYGPPEGYQPPHPYPYQPQQSYELPAYLSNENANTHHSAHSAVAQESYDYNRNAIPGLGLGFSNNGMVWQQDGIVHPGLVPEASQPVPTEQTTNKERSVVDHSGLSKDKPTYVTSGDEAMEEGELSEREVEDIYEPGENGDSASRLQLPGILASGESSAYEDQQHWEPRAARERSGSYSPYLSPREILSTRQASPVLEAYGQSSPYMHQLHTHGPHRIVAYFHAGTPGGSLNQQIALTSPSKIDETPNMGQRTDRAIPQSTAETPVADAKKEAKEVILRLWPLNIRYGNYVDEGVDKAVLDDLFTELGLDSSLASNSEDATTPTTTQTEPATNFPPPEKDEKETTACIAEEGQKPKDKSEERKDRIARLLAAKGTKATTPAQELSTAKTTATQPTTTGRVDQILGEIIAEVSSPPPATLTPRHPIQGTGPNKVQSEKSKLLQQKMEALRKSREATAKKVTQQQGLAIGRASL